MIDLIHPGNFEFFARYLLAGLIIIWIRANFVIGERARLTDMIVEAVILSLFNQLIFLLLVWLLSLASPTFVLDGRAPFFTEVLALPVLIGLVLGWGISSGWIHALFRLLSIPAQNVRRAYDFAFVPLSSPAFQPRASIRRPGRVRGADWSGSPRISIGCSRSLTAPCPVCRACGHRLSCRATRTKPM